MKRRDFVKSLGMTSLAASGVLSGCDRLAAPLPLEPYKPGFTPNILFISVDDLNDWVGCLGGYEGVHTPNIDRLASQSQLFTNAHCPAPICNPSRTATMFGLNPFSTGIYFNEHQMRLSQRLRNAPTLQQYLMKYGYLSTGSGKIYHRYDPGSWTSHYPERKTRFDEEYHVDKSLLPYPENHLFNWYALENFDESLMSDSKTAHWVAEQLAQPFTQPTFLACGIYLPHLPWILPKAYFDLYPLESISLPMIKEDDLDDIPEEGRKLAYVNRHKRLVKDHNWKKAIQAYLASITFMDAQVGKVLDALEHGPNKENTMVVLWSDHGWHLGEKLHWSKYTLWEEATRIPLIFKVPGLTKAGT
ncbi:MAG: sulfatase, partial [Pseudomonadales bacterium]|nr:sulfatase [Pseudomonadales bacterium]